MNHPPPLTLGQLAQWACILEVTTPKAGNVHPQHDFTDTRWLDFLKSAMVIAPMLDDAGNAGVGPTVLAAVRATQRTVGVNTNLGIILLLAPLCAVPRDQALEKGIPGVLASLTHRDTELVYHAINEAQPGGLGSVAQGDVHQPPTTRLIDAMKLAAARDRIAGQYATNFADLLDNIVPLLREAAATRPREQAIGYVHLQLIAQGDSLIGRKAGEAIMQQAAARAQAVLDADWPNGADSLGAFEQLDTWLRADGNRRNPGTSADLMAAALFVLLRRGELD